jgi:hypothetical protein
MTRGPVRRLVATCALLSALGLSGCAGDGDSPSSGPTPTPGTPIATPAATPTVATPSPTPTAGSAIAIAPEIESPAGFDLAAGPGGFLVAFAAASTDGTSEIFGVRLASDGSVVDEEPFLVSVGTSELQTEQSSPAVGFDGATYAVAYSGSNEINGIFTSSITAVLVGLDGSVGTPTTIIETPGIGMCHATVSAPAEIVGMPGSEFAVFWPLDLGCASGPMLDRIDGVFAAPSGTTFSSVEIAGLLPPIGEDTVQSGPASAASSETVTLASWSEIAALNPPPTTTIEVALLVSGSPAERAALATGPALLVQPEIASDGSDFLVVWGSNPGSSPSVLRGARFRPGTGPLDGPEGFVISSSQVEQGQPEVAFAGGVYVVVWTTPEMDGTELQLNAVAVATDGTVSDASVLATDLNAPNVAIAADGEVAVTAFLRAAAGGASSLEAVVRRP